MYEHIFHDHLLEPIHKYPLFNNKEELYWPSVILVICFAVFIILRITSFNKVFNVLKSSISLQTTRLMEREEFGQFKPSTFLLSGIFISMAAFLTYKLNVYGHFILVETKSLLQFLFFFGSILLFMTFKILFRRVLGFITDSLALLNEVFFSNRIIDQTIGLILIPLMVIVELTSVKTAYPLIISCILILCGQVIKLYRGVLFSIIENRISFFQVFIYLCALEVLPLLVFVKLIITNF